MGSKLGQKSPATVMGMYLFARRTGCPHSRFRQLSPGLPGFAFQVWTRTSFPRIQESWPRGNQVPGNAKTTTRTEFSKHDSPGPAWHIP